ncbi:hypothetical protein PDE01_25970 [Paracoccus denitrificans]|uniref:Uncharacterized protein n=1 Tax=Paracoccus denitrificans (strain Pd 1222) TaxID=318586 RepID=A1B3Q5_PARDP|nr:hypothetical protein Pden_2057 [Paracoccus denitrificans PD1222]GEK69077.1 hypothetical protein PDE01_25970 [Paracoccus denitrificans]
MRSWGFLEIEGLQGPQQICRETKGCAGREGDCGRLLTILPDVKDGAGADGDQRGRQNRGIATIAGRGASICAGLSLPAHQTLQGITADAISTSGRCDSCDSRDFDAHIGAGIATIAGIATVAGAFVTLGMWVK